MNLQTSIRLQPDSEEAPIQIENKHQRAETVEPPKFESIVCINTAQIWWEGIPDNSQRQMCCGRKMDYLPIFRDGHQSMHSDVYTSIVRIPIRG
jgi:hypothetical protein